MKIELRRENGELVYSLEGEGITMRDVVLDAYKKGIRNFSNCSLSHSDFSGFFAEEIKLDGNGKE